ncbi:TPA: hypothetical protein GLX13_18470 [Escherichia coli]|nr:hypothetical protein [Escherichia coli]EJD7275392.1 hypothetical protein [Escherichia coli]HAH2030708.1 hypothetical protein [Escherichia coli]
MSLKIYVSYAVIILLFIITTHWLIISYDAVWNGLVEVENKLKEDCIVTAIFGLSVVLYSFGGFVTGSLNLEDYNPKLIISGCVVTVMIQISLLLYYETWVWNTLRLFGTFLLMQFAAWFLIGGIERDIIRGRIPDSILNILPSLLILVPVCWFGWSLSSAFSP